jgi:hypothetical protein
VWGQRSATTVAIQGAASALTSRSCWQRAWPRASKQRPSVLASWPGAAHTSRPASWSTTTVRYRWPFLYDTSSMPIRRSPAKRSRLASASATTRVTMRPTVAQATPSSSPTACLEVWTASQAAVSSNARVWPAPWRAQGTAATTTPCLGQQTLGAPASRSAPTTPRSNARQRRRPSPWSKPGQRRPPRPQRRLTPLRAAPPPPAPAHPGRSRPVRRPPARHRAAWPIALPIARRFPSSGSSPQRAGTVDGQRRAVTSDPQDTHGSARRALFVRPQSRSLGGRLRVAPGARRARPSSVSITR